ncbi:MAG TPA: TIR domain-containing protein [Stenomitos sp.]
MSRKVFYSFHYQRDSWRASKIRNICVEEGNPSATNNKWEKVKQGGDAGIKRWMDDQWQGRTCTTVFDWRGN